MIRDWEPSALSRREERTLRALAEALYDPRATRTLEAHLALMLDEVRAWLAAPDITLRIGARVLLLVVELSPFRLGFGAHVMSRMPLTRRVAYLAALEARGAASLTLWKTLLGAAYFGHPALAVVLALDIETPTAPLLRLGRTPHTFAMKDDVARPQARAL